MTHIVREPLMAEPTSSGIAGYTMFKIAVAYGIPTATVCTIVMLMTKPSTRTEWIVMLMSTISASIYGGAFAIRYFGWQTWAAEPNGFIALGGIYLLCGLPAWVFLRWVFSWVERRKDKDLSEVALEVKGAIDYMRGRDK